jgi:hypothetical protein
MNKLIFCLLSIALFYTAYGASSPLLFTDVGALMERKATSSQLGLTVAPFPESSDKSAWIAPWHASLLNQALTTKDKIPQGAILVVLNHIHFNTNSHSWAPMFDKLRGGYDMLVDAEDKSKRTREGFFVMVNNQKARDFVTAWNATKSMGENKEGHTTIFSWLVDNHSNTQGLRADTFAWDAPLPLTYSAIPTSPISPLVEVIPGSSVTSTSLASLPTLPSTIVIPLPASESASSETPARLLPTDYIDDVDGPDDDDDEESPPSSPASGSAILSVPVLPVVRSRSPSPEPGSSPPSGDLSISVSSATLPLPVVLRSESASSETPARLLPTDEVDDVDRPDDDDDEESAPSSLSSESAILSALPAPVLPVVRSRSPSPEPGSPPPSGGLSISVSSALIGNRPSVLLTPEPGAPEGREELQGWQIVLLPPVLPVVLSAPSSATSILLKNPTFALGYSSMPPSSVSKLASLAQPLPGVFNSAPFPASLRTVASSFIPSRLPDPLRPEELPAGYKGVPYTPILYALNSYLPARAGYEIVIECWEDKDIGKFYDAEENGVIPLNASKKIGKFDDDERVPM